MAIISRGGRREGGAKGDMQPNGTPASVWEIFDALQPARRVFLGLGSKESRSSRERVERMRRERVRMQRVCVCVCVCV